MFIIVLGVVSGGRGVLGQCGGVNNPTHYVRYVLFTMYIITTPAQPKRNINLNCSWV